MTYCVGLCLDEGLVMLADTRTNAGLDNISTFQKLFTVEVPGERALALMTAGNLALTQLVWNLLEQGVWVEGAQLRLADAPNMLSAAQLVGAAVREAQRRDGAALAAQGIAFDCTFLLGGQIAGGPPRLYLVYSAGNFIESTPDTPFLQIGEHKYGKPILDRVLTPSTTLGRGVALTLISMDSTLRSNLSVGMPLDLAVIRRDALVFAMRHRLTAADPYFLAVQKGWADAIRDAYLSLPVPPELGG